MLRNKLDYNNICDRNYYESLKHSEQSIDIVGITYSIPERTISVGEFGVILDTQNEFGDISNIIKNKFKVDLFSITETELFYWTCGQKGTLLKVNKHDFKIEKIKLPKILVSLNCVRFLTNDKGIMVGDNNTINMSGSISSASDTYARGIYINGDNNTTTMSGSISAAGTDAYAMRHLGDDNTTTISGSVTSTGTASSALMNTSGSGGTFILDEGAVIIGDITALAAATNNKLKFNLGEDTSYAFTVGGGGAGTGAGQWTFTDQDGRTPIATTSGTNCASTGVTVCNLVTAVSSGNATEHNELQFAMNSSMIGSFQPSQSNSWANLYGDTSKRHASTTKLAFDTQNTGLTIGTPLAISKNINLDLVFNASNTNLDIGSAKEQEITAKSINVGAIIRDLFPSNTWLVDAFGFVGRNTYDGKRKVMNNNIATGSETVTAAYSGNEILLGLDAQYSQAINNTFNFTGGINANLSNEKIEAYSESKYYSWDARTMLQAAGGINLGLEHNKDALTTFASLGLQHSSLQKGKTATYTNNGTAVSFIDNATSDTRRSATVGFSYKASDNISFKGAVEAFTSENGVDGNSANLRINWAF